MATVQRNTTYTDDLKALWIDLINKGLSVLECIKELELRGHSRNNIGKTMPKRFRTGNGLPREKVVKTRKSRWDKGIPKKDIVSELNIKVNQIKVILNELSEDQVRQLYYDCIEYDKSNKLDVIGNRAIQLNELANIKASLPRDTSITLILKEVYKYVAHSLMNDKI